MIEYALLILGLAALTHGVGQALESRRVLGFTLENTCLFFYLATFFCLTTAFCQGKTSQFPWAAMLITLAIMFVHSKRIASIG